MKICTLPLYQPVFPGDTLSVHWNVVIWCCSVSALASTHKLYSKVLLRYTHAENKLIYINARFLVLMSSWYPGRSFSSCDVNWQVGCQEWDKRAWQRLQSMVIVFSSQPHLHCYFIYYLLHAWGMADTLQEKRKDTSLVSLMYFAVKHIAVPSVKEDRQASLFLWGISFSEAKNITNSSNSKIVPASFIT